MKKIKVFYLTKYFIETELNIKNVTVAHAPISVINNIAVVAKNFKWNSLEELKNDSMFRDIKATEGTLFIYELDVKQCQEFYDKMLEEAIIDNDIIEYVDNFKNAEVYQLRLFNIFNK